jgi:ribosomal protein S18 acetylase RimI-like enzyme
MQIPIAPPIKLVPVSEADLPFLFQVYASTRTRELAQAGWPPAQQQEFLLMQARMQHAHYTARYCHGQYYKIRAEGQDVGRLYLDAGQDDVHVIDIAILPAFRNRGIGSAVLRAVQAAARGAGAAVSLQVEKGSPAGRLYDALGFEPAGDSDTHAFMRWSNHAP